MACLSWTAVAWSADEGAAIEKVVKEAAMASATYSETRDRQAVLKLYTKDYIGIQDGETETRESIEKWFSDYESELNKGNTLRFINEHLNKNWGWDIVLITLLINIIILPLRIKTMQSGLKMQRIQPELQEIQGKFKSDPQRQQAEIMRVYKDHGMSPFSAFSGCLPMLIPMPVLFALFFVFQNTIEFRGVPFLWLHDISMHDPLYALPLLMGASAFALSWIGMRNSPPNPQAKMMSYIFPVMMTFIFLNQAAGLNLYYAVQNLAALPQQWLIANERARSQKKG